MGENRIVPNRDIGLHVVTIENGGGALGLRFHAKSLVESGHARALVGFVNEPWFSEVVGDLAQDEMLAEALREAGFIK